MNRTPDDAGMPATPDASKQADPSPVEAAERLIGALEYMDDADRALVVRTLEIMANRFAPKA